LYSIRPRTGTDEFVFFVVFAFEFQLKSFKFKPLFLILTKSFSIQLVFQPLDFQLQPLDFQLQPLDFQLQPLDFQLQLQLQPIDFLILIIQFFRFELLLELIRSRPLGDMAR
jgi:hypothetical protein